MNILYIVMGGAEALRYYMEAYLSIRTFQKQITAEDRIFVVTDHPEMMARAGVEIITISEDEKTEWMGQHKFFFRTKIRAVQHLSHFRPRESILYLDSDTFLFGNLSTLRQRLNDGKGLMHVCEGHPLNISNAARRLYRKAEGHTYAGITVGKNHMMWNAGVVGIPAGKVNDVMQTSLSLCDGMLDDGANSFITEQYASSIAMTENTSLMEAADVIGHYWGNKDDWEQLANRIFLRAYMQNLTLEEELAMLDIYELCKTPVRVHHSHRGEQLHCLVSRWFPDKDKQLVKQP